MPPKEYLINGIGISFDTACVGSIELLEQQFGFLWGHGKPLEDLDEDEQYYREIWKTIRREIFNKSETAKKIATQRFKEYTITKKKVYKDYR